MTLAGKLDDTKNSSNPRKRKLDKASRLLEEDKYSNEGWNAVIKACQRKSKVEEQRPTLDEFLKVFPTASRQWKYYIEREMYFKNYDRVEKLFQKCLLTVLDMELWTTYLSYIRMVKRGAKDERKSITEAYQFVLKHMGHHITAKSVWAQYIKFLKDSPAPKVLEFSNKIEKVRAAYHRAVVAPITGVDVLWREYEQWENSNHKLLAKGLIQGLQPKHLLARNCARERKRLRRCLLQNMLSRPPGGNPTMADRNYKQVQVWQDLIKFEKTNMQKLSVLELKRRLIFTYKQALMHLRLFPQIWNDYAVFVSDPKNGGHVEEGIAVFEKSLEAIPSSAMMVFLYSEFLELHKRFPEIHKIYDNLLERKIDNEPLIWCQYMKTIRRTEGKEAARKLFIRAMKSPDCSYHIYICATEIEQYINKDPKVATKLYRMGFDKYINEPDYVVQYIDFLTGQNDHQNLRVVYERVLSSLEPKHPRSREIWERFVEFQQTLLELPLIHKADSRLGDFFEATRMERELQRIHRFSFMDLKPVGQDYVDCLKRAIPTKRASLVVVQPGNDFPEDLEVTKDSFTNPDISQLIQFRPGVRFLKRISNHEPPRMPELKPALENLMKLLPRPNMTQLFYHSFLEGPCNVNVNVLMELLRAKDPPLKLHSLNKSAGPGGTFEQGDLFAQRRAKRIALASTDNLPVAKRV